MTEKRIISNSGRIEYGWGTSKYRLEWAGDWTVEELVNYCDGGSGNYGGRIDDFRQTENGTYKGTVCVYYD